MAAKYALVALAVLLTASNAQESGPNPQDLEVAESRYKVVAKPEPYKLRPAPPLDDYSIDYEDDNLRDPKSYVPVASTTSRPPAIRVTEAPLPTKISLKDYLKSQGKFDLQSNKEDRRKKAKPKTKYDTDTVIYPTTTYRPQTFAPTSPLAKEYALAFKSKLTNTEKTTPKTTQRPYGTKKSKKGKNGRVRRLKKVRRKKVFFDNARNSNKKRQEQLKANKKKEAKKVYPYEPLSSKTTARTTKKPRFNFRESKGGFQRQESKPKKTYKDLFYEEELLEKKEERKRNPLHQPLLVVNAVKPTSSYLAPADYYAPESNYNKPYRYVPPSPSPPPAYGAEDILGHHEVKTLGSPYEYKPKFAKAPRHKAAFVTPKPVTVTPKIPLVTPKIPHHATAFVTPAPVPQPTLAPAAIPATLREEPLDVFHDVGPYPDDDYHDGYYEEYEPKPYSFTYGVKDDYSGADFSRVEERTGAVTKGSYKVALPDGRVQIVNYVADENGYKASVTYEGEPSYPAPNAFNPEPALIPELVPTVSPKGFRHSKKVETFVAPTPFVAFENNEVFPSPGPEFEDLSHLPQKLYLPTKPAPVTPRPVTTTYRPPATPVYPKSRFLEHALTPLVRTSRKTEKTAPKATKQPKKKAKTYPNFKPIFDYAEEPSKTKKRPAKKATTPSTSEQIITTTYFPATTSIGYRNYPTTTPQTTRVVSSTTTKPRVYVTSPKPTYPGPYSSDFKSTTKVTTYRPVTSFQNEIKNNAASNYQDDLDYYDYYYEAALDYIQGRINQLNNQA